jgi:hypothetical protein
VGVVRDDADLSESCPLFARTRIDDVVRRGSEEYVRSPRPKNDAPSATESPASSRGTRRAVATMRQDGMHGRGDGPRLRRDPLSLGCGSSPGLGNALDAVEYGFSGAFGVRGESGERFEFPVPEHDR